MIDPNSPRAAMIRCAADLIARNGVAGTSIGDVLAAAGAARGSVYYHFPGGRAELMREAVYHGGEELGAELNSARRLPLRTAVPAVAQVWRRRLLASDFAAGCPVGAGAQCRDTDPTAADAATEVFLQWRHLLAARLREEDFDDRRADELADAILTAIEGAVVLCRARRSVAPIDTAVGHLLELLERRRSTAAEEAERAKTDDDFARRPAATDPLG
ncbi:MAG: TetR/AcrR family transcriptional regulator [Gordonia sp. (in: high G+C Gram-positive bacteria)]|uniref:TetR/AcrR family transcriptional regulator n=1 Tax=Gordonia sp. (in: high G+C Gram-positive bacteria) TaxID=84139 RepID=UPI003C76D40A